MAAPILVPDNLPSGAGSRKARRPSSVDWVACVLLSEVSTRRRTLGAGAGFRPIRGGGGSRLVDNWLRSESELPMGAADLPSAFGCEVISERDRLRVATTGELDLLTAPELEATVRELWQVGFRHVIVDLSEAGFLDVSGVGALLKLDASARGGARIVHPAKCEAFAHGFPS
jgi:anti-anti-sigma factor